MKKQYMLTLLFSGILVSYAHANTLIITRGPVCSAMGSYLRNAIQSVDDSYNTFSQNEISNVAYYQVFDTLFPQQMAVISGAIDRENISYAITNYHVYFKETAYEYQKQQALDAIAYIRETLNNPKNESMYEALISITEGLVIAELSYHAACKHNVVWEGGTVVNFDDTTTAIKNYFDNTIATLTYCPPTEMIERWQQKERQAIAEKKAFKRRLLKQVLNTFFNTFKPTNNEQDAVIMLTKDEFDRIIEQAADYIQTVPQAELGENGIFTRTEFTLEELAEFKEKIYVEYNFYNTDSVALVPSLSYDILLSSKEDCLNFAQRIANNEF